MSLRQINTLIAYLRGFVLGGGGVGCFNVADNSGRVRSENFSNCHEFDDVKAPLAAFYLSHVGLRLSDAGGQFMLAEFRRFPSVHKRVDQCTISGGVRGLHGRRPVCGTRPSH